MIEISKELLSEVLNKNVKRILHLKVDNQINYEIDAGFRDINIYELAHKCKEYLLDEGYYIIIHPFKVELFEKDTNSFIRAFKYPIQDKAIPYDIKREIQACQWILDNKESK